MLKVLEVFNKSKKLFTKNFILTFSLVILLVLALLTSFYFYSKYQAFKNTSNALVSRSGESSEVEKILKSVGALIELPQGENPTLATVSDKTKLSNQDFFKKAENGDKVLIYTGAKMAILYRPSMNKLINIASVNLGSSQTATASAVTSKPSPTKSKTYKIVLYNGTATVGLTAKVQQDLYSKTKEFEVLDRDNASSDTYSKTLVVDFIGNSSVAKALATFVGGEVVSLPEGEKKPENADFLVILGSDQN